MSITVTKKSQEVLISLKNITKNYKQNIRKALHDIGNDSQREVVKLITTGAKTGRIYRISGRTHRASAPGQAPANLTGKLADSANYRVRSHNEMTLGESAPYAKFLENGTRKMAPRPHVIRAINNTAGSAYTTLEKAGLI